MSTLKKDFREAVRAYIFESIEFEDNPTNNDESKDWQLAAIYHQFKIEKIRGDLRYNRTDLIRPINERDIFIEWISGLPTNVNIEFREYEQCEIMRGWFEAAGMEFDESRFDFKYFYSLIAREFYALLDKYNIQ